jgi:hypothetical protein
VRLRLDSSIHISVSVSIPTFIGWSELGYERTGDAETEPEVKVEDGELVCHRGFGVEWECKG